MNIAACAEIVRRGDPDRFLAVMAAPPGARTRLFPLYAFNVEVARAPWVTDEPTIARMRLQWWHDVLDQIAGGGPVRAHEVATPLAEAIGSEVAQDLHRLVVAREWDIDGQPFADLDALLDHLDASAGTLQHAAARALGRADEELSRQVGLAVGAASWLAAVPRLRAAGRAPLADEMIRPLAEEGMFALNRARRRRRSVPPDVRLSHYAAWWVGPVLQRAHRSPGRVGAGLLASSEVSRRARVLLTSVTGRW